MERRFSSGLHLTCPVRTADLQAVRHQSLRGFPPISLAGRVIIALRRSNSAVTVIPTSRRGREISHTKGYRIRARRAAGQHITNSSIHNKNFVIFTPHKYKRKFLKICFKGTGLLLGKYLEGESGSNPHFSPDNYCGGVYVRPDWIKLCQPPQRTV